MAPGRSYKWLYVFSGLMTALILVSCGDSTPKKPFGLDIPTIKKDLEMKQDGEPYDACLLPRILGNPLPEMRIALVEDRDVAVEFSWEEEPGQPDGTALLLHSAGDRSSLFQVFSRGNRPFARSGLEVTPLQAGVKYQIIARWIDRQELEVSVIRSSTGAVVLQSRAAALIPDLILAVGSGIEGPQVRRAAPANPALASL